MPLESKLNEIIATIPKAVRDAELAGAELVAEGAKARVNFDESKAPHLRDAIHVEETEEGAYVLAGNSKVFWGRFVEHGTSHSPPFPFLIPSLEENREEILALIAAALREAV